MTGLLVRRDPNRLRTHTAMSKVKTKILRPIMMLLSGEIQPSGWGAAEWPQKRTFLRPKVCGGSGGYQTQKKDNRPTLPGKNPFRRIWLSGRRASPDGYSTPPYKA